MTFFSKSCVTNFGNGTRVCSSTVSNGFNTINNTSVQSGGYSLFGESGCHHRHHPHHGGRGKERAYLNGLEAGLNMAGGVSQSPYGIMPPSVYAGLNGYPYAPYDTRTGLEQTGDGLASMGNGIGNMAGGFRMVMDLFNGLFGNKQA
jgi:hypothetical protein